MSDTQAAETPMSDHVERFWRHLKTETRIVLDLKRVTDGGWIYWDGSSFSNEVAKAIVAEHDRLTAENEKLKADIKGIGDFVDEILESDNHFPQIALRDVLFRCAQALGSSEQ